MLTTRRRPEGNRARHLGRPARRGDPRTRPRAPARLARRAARSADAAKANRCSTCSTAPGRRSRAPARASATTTRCWSSRTTRSTACCCAGCSACRCRGCGPSARRRPRSTCSKATDVDHLDVVRLNDCDAPHARCSAKRCIGRCDCRRMRTHAATRLARLHRAPASEVRSTWAWTACAKSRSAWASARPAEKVDHRRRHQRQGLDRRLHRGDRARRGLARRRLHLAAPAALQRARAHRWRDAGRRAPGRRLRGRRSRARRHAADLLRIRHAAPRCGCSTRSGSTWRSSKSASADAWMRSTSSMPTSR